MQLTFLGTGTSMGIPVICCACDTCKSDDIKDKRLRTSVLLETDNNIIVIDSGPDFRQQMLRENVKHVDAILITHTHKDHIAGLDDVRAYNYFMNKPMDVYGSPTSLKFIKQEFFYVFEDKKYPGIPEINLIEITDNAFKIKQDKITPIQGMHHKLSVLGFRINDFTYITDVNYIPEAELQKIKGSKTLVINALRKKKHLSHFTLTEALEVINFIQPENAYLTHISHQMGKHADIQKELQKNVFLAYDGLKIKV